MSFVVKLLSNFRYLAFCLLISILTSACSGGGPVTGVASIAGSVIPGSNTKLSGVAGAALSALNQSPAYALGAADIQALQAAGVLDEADSDVLNQLGR